MVRSKIGMSVSAALLLGMVSLAGCGANDSAKGNDMHTNSVRGNKNGRIQTNSVQGNTFDNMKMSQELADRIAALPEVGKANVVLAGKAAYVAVSLDRANGGISAKSTDQKHSYNHGGDLGIGTSGLLSGSGRPIGMNSGNGNGNGNGHGNGHGNGSENGNGNGSTGTGMNGKRGSVTGTPGMTGTGGSMAGIPKSRTGTGTVGGTGMANPENYPGNGNNGILSGNELTNGPRMQQGTNGNMDRGMGMRSVAPNNSNQMSGANEDVTRDMKDKIAAVVKKNNSNIKNVYVSANPDFVERAEFYAQEVRAGHPLKGFANEFRTMVERIFPNRSGS